MSYTGHPMATLGSKALWVLVLSLFCFLAALALFPSAHEAFWGDARGGAVILQMPRLLVILLFGGIAAPIAWALVFAIWRKKAVVVMNKEGVTCGGLLERSRHVAWADIVSIDQRWPEMMFIGGPSGQTVLARFPTVGHDLRAIWAVIAHYRPDLGKMSADNRSLLARLIQRRQGTRPSPTPF